MLICNRRPSGCPGDILTITNRNRSQAVSIFSAQEFSDTVRVGLKQIQNLIYRRLRTLMAVVEQFTHKSYNGCKQVVTELAVIWNRTMQDKTHCGTGIPRGCA